MGTIANVSGKSISIFGNLKSGTVKKSMCKVNVYMLCQPSFQTSLHKAKTANITGQPPRGIGQSTELSSSLSTKLS